jgi:hypothetical protein
MMLGFQPSVVVAPDFRQFSMLDHWTSPAMCCLPVLLHPNRTTLGGVGD